MAKLGLDCHHLNELVCLLMQVLLEWCDAEYHEWVTLNDGDTFQAVFLEKTLLWARRVLPSEMQRAVAWPAKVQLSCIYLQYHLASGY